MSDIIVYGYMKKCKVISCQNLVGKNGGHGLCAKHSRRLRETGSVELEKIKCVDCGETITKKAKTHLRCKLCAQRYYLYLARINAVKYVKDNSKELICFNCKKTYIGYKSKFCSKKCMYESSKKTRLGKNNPAYRNGNYCGKKIGTRQTGGRACKKYRKDFIEKNGYLFCEICKTSSSLRFEVHHLIFRSEAPNHKNLHKEPNLILTCIACHNKLHKKKSNRDKIVKERELYKLFPETPKLKTQ
jgi:5-methylcytosine-specific restriction endonuclease McrA